MARNKESKERKKALVTGAAGFIGFALSKHLHSLGYDVTLCDNLIRGRMDDELKEFLKEKGTKFINCDLTEKKELEKLDKDYDYVYHLAAINGTKYFYEKPDLVLKVNVIAVYNILEWFKDSKCKKLLFSSSSETYAGTVSRYGAEVPTKEDVPLCVEDVQNPRWSYGGSKIIGELFVINYARMNKFKASIIRYHNIYGPRMGFEHVIPEFCIRIRNKESPFKVFGGKETRAFCFIEDAIEATKLVMESEKTNGEIVHIGNNLEEISIIDLAKSLFSVTGWNPELKILPAPKGSVKRRCPDISKLRSLTGFSPKTSLKSGLKITHDWYKKAILPE